MSPLWSPLEEEADCSARALGAGSRAGHVTFPVTEPLFSSKHLQHLFLPSGPLRSGRNHGGLLLHFPFLNLLSLHFQVSFSLLYITSNPFLFCFCLSILASLFLCFGVISSTVVIMFSELDLCSLKEWLSYSVGVS